MSTSRGPSFTPDAAKATDATVDAAARAEAAQDLVRGHAVREAASDALVHAAGDQDDHDTGPGLPSDVASGMRTATRVAIRARDAARSAEERKTEGIGGTATDVPRQGDVPDTTPTSDERTDIPLSANGFGASPTDDVVSQARAQPTGDMTPRGSAAPRAGTDTRVTPPTRKGMSASNHPAIGATSARGTPGSARWQPTKVLARTSTGSANPRSLKARRNTRRSTAKPRVTAVWHGAGAAGAPASAAATSAGAGVGGATSGEAAVAAAPVVAVALVAFLLVFVLLSLLAGGAVEEDQLAGAHRLAQAATDEYLAGEARGDYNHKGLTYSAYVRGTHGGKRDWDVCLVGWCMAQAGFVDVGLTSAYGDVSSYVAHFRYDAKLGEVHDWYAGAYTPVEGDLFVSWYTDGSMHIGIVTSCDGTVFETVEGDVAGGPDGLYDLDEEDGLGGYVACRTRLLGQYSYTFIHPYYSEEAVTGR